MTAHRSKTPIAVGIVGPGLIGSTLIKQLAAQVTNPSKSLLQASKIGADSASLGNLCSQYCAFVQSRSLQNDLFIDLHIVAIVSTRAMYLYNQKGCDMETWQTDLAMGVSTM